MKYQLKNIRLSSGTVQTQGIHFGEKYQWLSAELYNDEDIFANPARLPRFYCMTDAVIELYKPYAKPDTTPGAIAGTLLVDEALLKQAITDGKTPGDLLHISQVHTYIYDLDTTYARVYRADVLDPQTRTVVHKKNDFIKGSNNEVVPVTQLMLYLKKRYDAEAAAVDPQKAWQWVENPAEVARRVIERSYRRYETSATQATPGASTEQPADTSSAEVEAARQALAGAGV